MRRRPTVALSTVARPTVPPGVGRVGYVIDPDHTVVALFAPEAG